MDEIERTLRRAASTPCIKHNKGKAKGQKIKIQEILNTLNPPSVPLNETLPAGSHNTTTTSISESGAPLTLPLLIIMEY